jgi:hypothetical protein
MKGGLTCSPDSREWLCLRVKDSISADIFQMIFWFGVEPVALVLHRIAKSGPGVQVHSNDFEEPCWIISLYNS